MLTLNVKAPDASIKRYRIANLVKKQVLTVCCLPEALIFREIPYLHRDFSLILKKINTALESKGGKRFSKQMDPINRQE
jgi:hypothetical protein